MHLIVCFLLAPLVGMLQWDSYTFSAKVINNMFSYLNRHWVKRETEEGAKHVYVHSLSLRLFFFFRAVLWSSPEHSPFRPFFSYDVYKLTLVVWRDILYQVAHEKLKKKFTCSGLPLFFFFFFARQALRQPLVDAIMDLITRERNGEKVLSANMAQRRRTDGKSAQTPPTTNLHFFFILSFLLLLLPCVSAR